MGVEIIGKLSTGAILAKRNNALFEVSLNRKKYERAPIQNIEGYYKPGMFDQMNVKEEAQAIKILNDGKVAKTFNEILAENTAETTTEAPQEEVTKSAEQTQTFNIMKTDDDKRLIFGWASVAIKTDGEQVVDHQNDMLDPEDLEEAVYSYVLNFRDGGEEHIPNLRKKARMVESCMFTKEKMQAMGIPEGIVPEGWWIGFYVDDDDAWAKVKDGTYQMFSIEGQGVREEVDDDEEVKKNDNIEKFNPHHDERGRFASIGAASRAPAGTISDTEWMTWAFDAEPIKEFVQDGVITTKYDSTGIKITDEEREEFKVIGTKIQEAAQNGRIPDRILYRGESFDSVEEFKERYKYNRKIETQTITSASPDIEVARAYADGVEAPVQVVVRFNNTNGHKGVHTEPMGVPSNEIVLPKGEQYRVSRIIDEGNNRYTVDLYSTVKHGKVQKSHTAQTFDEILKFNPYHGKDGRFASANGGTASAGSTQVDEDANPEYRYHSTSFRNARSIQDDGVLKPSTHAEYGEGVYFAPNVEGTKGWTSEENEQVHLRVRHQTLTDQYEYDEFQEQGWTENKGVSTAHIEIKVGDQRWINIDDADIRDDDVYEW